ncbi:uncharacterized protein I303_107618 [Kwoniella dejecticola CBS 10117]|uniref:Uncharacterized protein n=1 Tax=Kwoniella dejecticola CBS 10117 TaxID=1296121 RepID=A0A1A5ZV87_9TREE|nr:uncharacterized protein I303_07629 [Kwoniella dejecticola CBS 10117]OBR81719.1 hypothetical protein I303_07629 [Kwoniella dejecticola CBS 10117]
MSQDTASEGLNMVNRMFADAHNRPLGSHLRTSQDEQAWLDGSNRFTTTRSDNPGTLECGLIRKTRNNQPLMTYAQIWDRTYAKGRVTMPKGTIVDLTLDYLPDRSYIFTNKVVWREWAKGSITCADASTGDSQIFGEDLTVDGVQMSTIVNPLLDQLYDLVIRYKV